MSRMTPDAPPQFETTLKGRVVFVVGATRGIGFEIARRAAQDGAKIVVAGKTQEKHPKLDGTIDLRRRRPPKSGRRSIAVTLDVRDADAINHAVDEAIKAFGGIDACVCNASAIDLSSTLDVPVKKLDLMNAVNGRGTFLAARACLPHLLRAENPHVIALAPPIPRRLDRDALAKHLAPKLAYSISKYAMSLFVLGLAEEFRGRVGVNALWPRTMIATAAIANVVADQNALKACRSPEIVADAAHRVLTADAKTFSGNFLIDDSFLRRCGVNDLDRYAVDPETPLAEDFFLMHDEDNPA